MPILMMDAVDFAKVPAIGLVVPVYASDPAGYMAGLIYNSAQKALKFHNGTAWIALHEQNAVAPPTGPAGGDLTGTYPNPQIAAGTIIDTDISASAGIAQSKVTNLPGDLADRAMKATTVTAGAGLTGGGDLSANRFIDVGAGTGIVTDATTVGLDLTYADGRYINTTGDTLTGFLTLNADPTAPLHAASKNYVDITSQGFSFKEAVRVVSTTNVATSGLLTIDGITLVANDRVLLTAQTTASQNGIWIAAAGAWTRALDMDATGELKDGTLVPVGSGTVNLDSQWMCTATGASPWVPNSSTSTWTKFTSLADLNAGNGLTKTGTTIDFVGDANLNVAANAVSVLSAPKWTTTRTISLTGGVTGSANIDGTGNIAIASTVAIPKAYNANVGGSTSIPVAHNLGTTDVTVSLKNISTGDSVMTGWKVTDSNTVTLTFASAPASASLRCSVIAAA